jgi:hypothetical protein
MWLSYHGMKLSTTEKVYLMGMFEVAIYNLQLLYLYVPLLIIRTSLFE